MQEVIKVLMNEPRLLGDFNPEWVLNRTDRLVVEMMIGFFKMGIMPSPQNIDLEAQKLGATGMGAYVNERMAIDSSLDSSYVMATLRENHNILLLCGVREDIDRMVKSGIRSDAIEQHVRSNLRRVASDTRSTSMKMATDLTLEELKRVYAGEKKSFWETGHAELDRGLGWMSKMIVMVAAQQKQGKTLWTLDEVLRLLKHNPELRCDYYNFEQSATKMTPAVIGWLTGIDTAVIKAKTRMPTEHEQEHIFKSKTLMDSIPIRFFNEKMTMSRLRRSITNSADANTIIVIDNVGLIQPEAGMTDNQNDDYIARELVDIRDANLPLIIALHHLSKANESHFNKNEGFEPDRKDLRGSNRWGDYLDALVMLHRPEMYPQLKDQMGEDWEKMQGYMLVKCPLIRDGSPKRWHWRHQIHCTRFEEMPRSEVSVLMM